MVHQLNIYLLSFGALQGAVLSFFLLRKSRNDAARTFFALFLVVVGIQLTFKVFTKSWLWYNVNLLYLLSYSFPLLIGPSLYLFFRSRDGKVDVTWSDLLHAVPFLWHLINTLTGELLNFYIIPRYVWVLPFPSYHLISVVAYAIVSWKLIPVRELRQFLVIVVIVETIILFTMMLMIMHNPDFPDVRWLFISLTLLVYWISYKLFDRPDLFQGVKQPVELKPEVTVKYAHSGLKKDEADRIEVLIRDAIRQNLFLDSSISVDVMAKRFNVPRHHLSRVINERFQKNFNDLANGWRLEEARARLIDPKYKNLTISSIAYDCGFSSVSSFNTMFRRKFGTTPSAYRNISSCLSGTQ
ncbi:MAG TPA: AraC family transcriptional regulator [Cyclobacteriaceae bacterium]|nr:AraC family transcriptional regulator [Cyclobacteriaceae bacterium]